MSIGTFREWLREGELNEKENIVKFKDLSYIKKDEDAYTDLWNVFVDKKNKLLLMVTYYGDDTKLLKIQEKLNKEANKYMFDAKEVKYMFDDRDNEYRFMLFKMN